jgi:hypothetical protein
MVFGREENTTTLPSTVFKDVDLRIISEHTSDSDLTVISLSFMSALFLIAKAF